MYMKAQSLAAQAVVIEMLTANAAFHKIFEHVSMHHYFLNFWLSASMYI